MGWQDVIDVITGGLVKAIDYNQTNENIRVLGGNGTSAPSSDIESLSTLVAAMVAPTSQAGPPSSTPSVIGQLNVDTTSKRLYVATGTGSSADWDRIAYNDYGDFTVTSGGGDITVTLPQSWEGGTLILFRTETASEYFSDNNAVSCLIITTYDALTDTEATYDTDELLFLSTNPNISTQDKGVASGGAPKSASPLSFTVDDNDTMYMKWMVIS